MLSTRLPWYWCQLVNIVDKIYTCLHVLIIVTCILRCTFVYYVCILIVDMPTNDLRPITGHGWSWPAHTTISLAIRSFVSKEAMAFKHIYLTLHIVLLHTYIHTCILSIICNLIEYKREVSLILYIDTKITIGVYWMS